MMTDISAKRRFKVLQREQERLAEMGRRDPELDEQISQLITQYPILQEVKTSITPSSKLILALGEEMSRQEGSISTQRATEPQQYNNSAPSHTEPFKAQRYGTVIFLFLLRVTNDLRANPSTSVSLVFVISFIAFVEAVLHSVVIKDLCSFEAFATNPILSTIMIHVVYKLRCSNPNRESRRGVVERVLVYVIREVFPTLAVAILSYLSTLILLSTFLNIFPRRYCDV